MDDVTQILQNLQAQQQQEQSRLDANAHTAGLVTGFVGMRTYLNHLPEPERLARTQPLWHLARTAFMLWGMGVVGYFFYRHYQEIPWYTVGTLVLPLVFLLILFTGGKRRRNHTTHA